MASDLTNLNSSRLSALWPVLPTGPQTLLLQACLGSPDVIARSWNRWPQGLRDPRRFIRRDTWGIKSILPLLHDSLRRSDVQLDKDMQTLLRTAFFRERLRLATIHRICRGLLRTLAASDISSVLAGDLAIAESAYPVWRFQRLSVSILSVTYPLRCPRCSREHSVLRSFSFLAI